MQKKRSLRLQPLQAKVLKIYLSNQGYHTKVLLKNSLDWFEKKDQDLSQLIYYNCNKKKVCQLIY